MAINCLAHVLNLSAKALLLRLRLVDSDEKNHVTQLNTGDSVSDDNELDVFDNEVVEAIVKVLLFQFQQLCLQPTYVI